MANWANPVSLNGAKHLSKPLELWAVAFRNGDIVPGTSRMRVAEPIVEGTLQLVPSAAPWVQSNVLASLRPGDTIIVTQREGPTRNSRIWRRRHYYLERYHLWGSRHRPTIRVDQPLRRRARTSYAKTERRPYLLKRRWNSLQHRRS